MTRETRALKQAARKRGEILKAYARRVAATPGHIHQVSARNWLLRKGVR